MARGRWARVTDPGIKLRAGQAECVCHLGTCLWFGYHSPIKYLLSKQAGPGVCFTWDLRGGHEHESEPSLRSGFRKGRVV